MSRRMLLVMGWVSLLAAGCAGTPPSPSTPSAQVCRLTHARLAVFEARSEAERAEAERAHAQLSHGDGWEYHDAIERLGGEAHGDWVVLRGDRSMHPMPGEPRYQRLVHKDPMEVGDFVTRLVSEFRVFELHDRKLDEPVRERSIAYWFAFKDSCGHEHRFASSEVSPVE